MSLHTDLPIYKKGCDLLRLAFNGNCQWATQAEQNRNRPSHAVMLTHNGIAKSLTDWAHEVGITPNTLRMRIAKLGWSVEKALTTTKQRGKF